VLTTGTGLITKTLNDNEMEAKNLRIGNYVTWIDEDDPSNAVLTLVGIYLNDAIWVEWTWEDGSNDNTDCDLETIKGIPITEEWLNKFGFDDAEYKKGYTGVEFRTNVILDFVLTKPKFMGEWQDYYAFDLGQNRFVPMKYVHELQNLFFAVTSTELELKQESSACS
jgi:hypothetical protein